MTEGIHFLNHFYQQVPQNTEALEKNANDYPFSSFANLLLLYHYKKTNHSAFEKLAKKTVLHFKNPNWLQFLLDQPLAKEIATETSINSYPDKELKEAETHSLAEEPLDIGESSSASYETVKEEIEKVGEHMDGQNFANGIEETPESQPEEKAEIQEDEQITFGSQISPERDLQQEAKIVSESEEPAENEITFEPLHTVDYFASQGIKLTEEPVTNDKLGNQMKSFTAWLKSMKRLHPSKLEEQNVATEKIIQSSAEESNINTEILTEAMAEVLIKQDKKEKAIEMFSKLSLINPAKSAYFAAKIESIKSL